MIDPDEFRRRMAERWTGQLGNVYTERLGKQWSELAEVLNWHVTAHDNPAMAEKFTVVAAALGSGKSQGVALYCAMLAERFKLDEQPGAMIVCRRIEEADELAQTINRLSGIAAFAVAFHSEAGAQGIKLADLPAYPVVIVTHRGYQIALDRLAADDGASRWPEFSRYLDGHRRLYVIDEAIDLVEHDSLTVDGLKRAIACIPESIRREHLPACRLLEETLEHFRSLEDRFKLPDARRGVLYEKLRSGEPPDLTALRAALPADAFKSTWGMTADDVRDGLLETLRAVERVFRQWAYVMRLPTGDQTLHTARLILPRETKGAVILDATAKANTLYRLFGERIEVRALPFPTRDYRNVTLHVSRGHKTGKGYIVKNADEAAQEIVGNLSRLIGAGRKVLIVTHKLAEAAFAKYETPFERHTAHWGALDGSNAWRHCDAICIASLPRRPDSWATSSYLAITGDVRDEVLGDEGDNLRRDIHLGQIVSDVVQAIGRTRCRKVVDEHGNCDPVDVFLFLPQSGQGDSILDGIRAELPGCEVRAFTYAGRATRTRPKASRIEEALILCLRGLPSGRTAGKAVREALGRCSRASWERLTAALRDPSTPVCLAMQELGVVFVPGSRGRGAEASFLKA